MLRRRQTFKGGYRFRRLKGSPKPVLRETAIPSEVAIPLRQGFGEEVPSIVKVGGKVKAGQIIGIDDSSCSSPVHASINGTVKDIRTIELFGQEMGAVLIESDGSGGWLEAGTAAPFLQMDLTLPDLENSHPDEIDRALYISGVASLGRCGFPTRYNTSMFQPDDVDSLVVNAVNSEPFALSNEILLAGNVDRFLRGIDILRRALPGSVEVHIGIDDRDKEIIKEIEASAYEGGFETRPYVHPLKPKYPQDHDVVLVKTILGREVPYGGSASDVRAVVLDVQSVLHAYEAVTEGKPVIERVLALGGSGANENLFLKVRVGTPLKHIIQALENLDQKEKREIENLDQKEKREIENLDQRKEREKPLLFEACWHVAPNPAVAIQYGPEAGKLYMYTYNLTSDVDELYDLNDCECYRNLAFDEDYRDIKHLMIEKLGSVLRADDRWRCYWHTFRVDKFHHLPSDGGDVQMFVPV